MTTQDKKLELLTQLAKLSPVELAVALVKVERDKAQRLAKAAKLAKKTPRRTFADWGTPLNPR